MDCVLVQIQMRGKKNEALMTALWGEVSPSHYLFIQWEIIWQLW